MTKLQILKSMLIGGASAMALASPAAAKVFDIPNGDLATALSTYMAQSGVNLIYTNDVRGHKSRGARGEYTDIAALTQVLRGTGFSLQPVSSGAFGIVPVPGETKPRVEKVELAAAAPRAPAPGAVETVVVTALSQQQLTERQIAGGPDLLRDVPNMNFGKTNFSGYSIELRGIGTQAISVTTDPAVAVAFNDTPFIRNHFFEQEFFDLADVEVLRGPQGTLYGRNATAGVVNLVSAKPTDQFEAMGSVDIGNFSNRRIEGMINLPIVGDKLDLRAAGEWTKRDGYSFNELTNKSIDGRDLWSSRVSLRFKPTEEFDATLVWEHFQEDDDRLRSGKQLCKTAPIPASVNGVAVGVGGTTFSPGDFLSQGCLPTSLYSKDAFEVPNGFSLPYYSGFVDDDPFVRSLFDPYSSTVQSTNLRDIQSSIPSRYRAKNDVVELNADYTISPALTLTSQTGFSQDFLWSTEDYDRFETAPGIFQTFPVFASKGLALPDPNAGKNGIPADAAIFCDPQLGCQDRLVVQDLNDEHSWQLSQEFRLASHFEGPLNFSAGGNYLHYETEENYYVFINTLTQFIANNATCSPPYCVPTQNYLGDVGIDNSACLPGDRYPNNNIPSSAINGCEYIDPNPIGSLNNRGHNYFLSQNPYLLNSYALFGELYYNFTNDLKLTAGLRWTDDRKHFIEVPSEVLIMYSGYPSAGTVDQEWQRFTGRSVLSWTPKLDFTDQTLIYGSYAHGYKAGGANPPGALFPEALNDAAALTNPIHPLTFKPEYIDAYELGTKNTLLESSLTLNADIFYYNYQNYQISRIVDRTAINDNFNAHVMGAELESRWEPASGLVFNLGAGFEDARLANGTHSVDLMDRTAGNPNWIVVRPFITDASNCILPTYVVAAVLTQEFVGSAGDWTSEACGSAYLEHLDPVTHLPYTASPTAVQGGGTVAMSGYPGFDPSTAPNNGQGFDKNLSHHEMPNAPPVTLSFGAQYSLPVTEDWAATLRGDFYYQADSWARVFNDNPYDRLHGYTNLNLALILNSADGWQVMGYVKNVFDTTAITGDFLNSDDTGLTTNVFLTDPRLYGVRVTKDLNAGDWRLSDDLAGWFTDVDGKLPALWIELGGGLDQLDSPANPFTPPFMGDVTLPGQVKALSVQRPPRIAFDEDAKITFQEPDSAWVLSAAVRFGRASALHHGHQQTKHKVVPVQFTFYGRSFGNYPKYASRHVLEADGRAQLSESHAIIDFDAGRDVGLGFLGVNEGTSLVSGGVRFVQFHSRSNADLNVEPDVRYPTAPIMSLGEVFAFRSQNPPLVFHDFTGNGVMARSFNGVGPRVSWDASAPVSGDLDSGELSFDWGVNGALLFGRQKAKGHHQTTSKTYSVSHWYTKHPHVPGYGQAGFFQNANTGVNPVSVLNNSGDFNRARSVVVPNLGASIGLSLKYRNAKVSFGYRADEFFRAMDGGIDTRKSENVGFFGPYANVSIGIGG